jgi:hypothetical protein
MRPRALLRILAAVASAVSPLTAVVDAAISTQSLSEILADNDRRLISGAPADVTRLVSVLARPGLNILGAQILLGRPAQFGLFADGSDSIGIESGVILSTGRVADAGPANRQSATTTAFGGPGYGPMDALLSPGATGIDAAVLRIDFECAGGRSEEFHLQYVWASEEYNEVGDWLLFPTMSPRPPCLHVSHLTRAPPLSSLSAMTSTTRL